jgi:D-alanyl-lipoteichoic acid acyltransferase DltB (MBOAT superfamily)
MLDRGQLRRVICVSRDRQSPHATRLVLALLIAANLLALSYFKYLGFAAVQWQQLTGIDLAVGNIVLPIGISFYTFTLYLHPDRFSRRHCPREGA